MFHTAGIAEGLPYGGGKGIEEHQQTSSAATAAAVPLDSGGLVLMAEQLNFQAVVAVKPRNKLVFGDYQYVVVYKDWHFCII